MSVFDFVVKVAAARFFLAERHFDLDMNMKDVRVMRSFCSTVGDGDF